MNGSQPNLPLRLSLACGAFPSLACPLAAGTPVAGILAGGGSTSYGTRAGIVPEVHLFGFDKVLDARRAGHIRDVIGALDRAADNRAACGTRAINPSVGASVMESGGGV